MMVDEPVPSGMVLGEREAAVAVTGALLLGLLAQLLFWGQPAGINLVLWTAALLAAAVLVRPATARLDPRDAWLPLGAVAFAGFVALRSDPALILFDLLAAASLTVASVPALAGVAVTRRSLRCVALLATETLAALFAGATRLAPGVRALARPVAGVPRGPASALGRGLLIALPIAFPFVLLFAAADPVFARYVGGIVELSFLDLGEVPLRALFTLCAAWSAGGLLVLAARATTRVGTRGAVAAGWDVRRLGVGEALVVLVVVDLVFGLFVSLQARYLFGGRDTLGATGLSYSAYARSGFFELVAATVLSGLLLLALESVVRRRSRSYLAAALVLVALTAVVLASATIRLTLYQQAYGWTELRFYVLAAIVWLGLALASGAVTLLLDRTRWLVHALVMAGVAVALGVNVVGPQAFVASRNVERALHPEIVPADGETGVDAEYLATLGDDAVPVLLDALPRLGPTDRDEIQRALRARLVDLDAGDAGRGWAGWNLARERARTLLEAAREGL